MALRQKNNKKKVSLSRRKMITNAKKKRANRNSKQNVKNISNINKSTKRKRVTSKRELNVSKKVRRVDWNEEMFQVGGNSIPNHSKCRNERRLEYQRLQEIIPTLRTRNGVSKVTLIEEAAKYITYLRRAVIRRFGRSTVLPITLSDNWPRAEVCTKKREEVDKLVVALINFYTPSNLPPSAYESNRKRQRALDNKKPPAHG